MSGFLFQSKMIAKKKNTRKSKIFSEIFFGQKKKKKQQTYLTFWTQRKISWQKKKKNYQGGKNAYLRRGNISGSKIKYQLNLSFSKISFWVTKDNDNETLTEKVFTLWLRRQLVAAEGLGNVFLDYGSYQSKWPYWNFHVGCDVVRCKGFERNLSQ